MIKGIDQNVNPEKTPKDFVYWAKNGVVNSKLDAAINEQGNLEKFNLTSLNINFKNGVIVLGGIIILFYKDLSGNDCIATLDEETEVVTVRLTRTDFNFLINYPITGRAKLNARNEIVVAFGDGYNRDKYVNLYTVSISDSLNFYNLFPIVNNPTSIITEVQDSGALLTGAYFITTQYIARDRSRSGWTTISNPVYVTLNDDSQIYVNTKGTNSGVASNKSIKVTLTDLDENYTKLAIAVISKINGVVTAKIIKEVSITDSTISFVYTGVESLGTVAIEELVQDNIVYTSSKHRTSVNDQLFLADLTAPSIIDFQHIANNINVDWRSTLKGVVNDAAIKTGNNNKTFAHDEVYALYVQFELLETGTWTEWFHIPGRALIDAEKVDSGLYNAGLQINGRNPKTYEVNDTATYFGGLFEGGKYGIMGAWENSNEVYPANFPDFAGQKVRHHKFPSVGFMQGVWGGTYGINSLDSLGIQTTMNVSDARIKGYRVGYARRSLSDVGVLGTGLTIFGGYPEGGDQDYIMNPGGNFRLACQDGAGDDILINKNYLRFNSFDLWQDRPAITGAYLRNYLKLKANKLSLGDAGYAGDSTYGTIAQGHPDFDMCSYISNFTKDGVDNATITGVIDGDKIRKLTKQNYVPNNVKYNIDTITIENRYVEECVLAKIEGTNLDLDCSSELKTQSNIGQASPGLFEEVYLSALKTPKSDYFIGFDNQTIVVNPQIIRVPTTTAIDYIGDNFIGMHSYATLAPYKSTLSVLLTDISKSVINFKVHLGISRHNVNQRYIINGDYSTYFYPDSGLFTKSITEANQYWFYSDNHSRDKVWNSFQYSKDFSTVNDLEVFGVFDRDSIDTSNFNFRIHRSLRASRENSLEDGWRTFKALDYFDTVRDKGRITNLEAWGSDALIIHHERALFKTRDKAVLQANIINISLGSGDIFALEPKEVVPTNEGTGGTQHKFSCRLTPYGYFFVDKKGYTVYMYDGGDTLQDVTKGLSWFFALHLTTDIDNPFNDEGITIAYDPYYDRLLLSHKGENNFTVSLDLDSKEWVFAHDFIPDYMFNTRSNMYSFKTFKLWEHNSGVMGSYYGTIYPFYVDFVINTEDKIQKVLSALYWISKVKANERSVEQRKTITSITVWNDQMCTGKILINTNETESLFVDANAKVVDEGWSFNDLFDLVNDPTIPFVDDIFNDSRPLAANLKTPVWYDSEPLRGRYFIVRLEYSNIENKEVHLRELEGLLRASAS